MITYLSALYATILGSWDSFWEEYQGELNEYGMLDSLDTQMYYNSFYKR